MLSVLSIGIAGYGIVELIEKRKANLNKEKTTSDIVYVEECHEK